MSVKKNKQYSVEDKIKVLNRLKSFGLLDEHQYIEKLNKVHGVINSEDFLQQEEIKDVFEFDSDHSFSEHVNTYTENNSTDDPFSFQDKVSNSNEFYETGFSSSNKEQTHQKHLHKTTPTPLGNVSSLTPYEMQSNWFALGQKLPKFLLRDRSYDIDKIANRLLETGASSRLKNLHLYSIPEKSNNIASRPIRFLHCLSCNHYSTTDVSSTQQGYDLFVEFDCKQRTPLTWIRLGFYFVSYLLIFTIFITAYYNISGAYKTLAIEFAGIHAADILDDPDASPFFSKEIVEGSKHIDWLKFRKIFERKYSLSIIEQYIKTSVDAQYEVTMRLIRGQSKGMAFGDFLVNMMDSLGPDGASIYAVMHANLAVYGAKSVKYEIETYFNGELPELSHSDTVLKETNFFYPSENQWHFSLEAYVALLKFIPNVVKDKPNIYGPIVEVIKESTTTKQPWSGIELILADPKLAAFSLGVPATIISMLVAGITWLIPTRYFRLICQRMGAPTTEEYVNFVQSRNVSIERMLSDVLLNDFGIDERDKFPVNT